MRLDYESNTLTGEIMTPMMTYEQLLEEVEELRQENMELKNRIEELEIENHYNEHQLNYTVHMLSKIHDVIEDTGLFNDKEETL